MPQTAVKIEKNRIKEEIEYLQTGLTMQSRDLETIQNINTMSDFTRDDKSICIPINVRPDVNNIVEDIINNTI